MRLRKSAHSVYKTQYHIIWITRYRKKILVTGVREYLRITFQEYSNVIRIGNTSRLPSRRTVSILLW
ncbi:MAG: hypothetical protein GX428_02375 [Candidatus Atribacteria bacterium]|nr:hypothetical protein [Candidatus Atribacteria bacterium]